MHYPNSALEFPPSFFPICTQILQKDFKSSKQREQQSQYKIPTITRATVLLNSSSLKSLMRKLLIRCCKKKKKSHWAYGESICLRSSDFPSLSGMQVTRINVAQPDLGSTEYYWLSLVYMEMPNPKPPHLINPLRLELQDMFRQQ